MKNEKKLLKKMIKIATGLFFISLLNACGNSSDKMAENTTVTKIPTPLQKLEVGQGELSAYVQLDGSSIRTPMIINTTGNGTASVELLGLSLAVHTILITYEYTDENGSFILAQVNKEVDLSTGSTILNVDAEEYSLAFDEDFDGINNTEELLVGTDPRISDLGGINLVAFGIKTSMPILSEASQISGALRAFVIMDGNSIPANFVIDAETGFANVTVLGLNQRLHTFSVTFEYTDDVDTITVAKFDGSIDLTFRGQEIELDINNYVSDIFNKDGDVFTNAEEISQGSNPHSLTAPFANAIPILSFEKIKSFSFNWSDVRDAIYYRLLEDLEDTANFVQVGDNILQGMSSIDHIVPLYARLNAKYKLQSCNDIGCIDSDEISVSDSMNGSIGFFRTDGSSPGGGASVKLSADGNVLVVGHRGSVTTFDYDGQKWQQQASFTGSHAVTGAFGSAIALSKDGSTLAVSDELDDNNSLGIRELLRTALVYSNSGAVYVYERIQGEWIEQAYLKASNFEEFDNFGVGLSISNDGKILAVGAAGEDSDAIGTLPSIDQLSNSASASGAAYVFNKNTDNVWVQQAYIKASNTGALDSFGTSLALSGDGLKLAVGAYLEDSNAKSIDGDQANNDARNSGAVYTFSFDDAQNLWIDDVYIKAINTEINDEFGWRVELNEKGNILAVSALGEDSSLRNSPNDNLAINSGAVYIFEKNNIDWVLQEYLKPSNIPASGGFGSSLSLNASGNFLVVGDDSENSVGFGFNGDPSNQSDNTGAVYTFRKNIVWDQESRFKAKDISVNQNGLFVNFFGSSVSLSSNEDSLAVGAIPGAFLY